MRFLRKFAAGSAALAVTVSLTGCGLMGGNDKDSVGKNDGDITTLTIGATPVPQAKILKFVDDNLAKDAGLDLEIKEFTDYALPNQALNDGDIDANYFQHEPYLKEEISKKGYKLAHFKGIHIEPLALYSSKAKSVDEIKDGGKIAIPNDPSNMGRSLKLLADAGLIKIKDGVEDVSATIHDIAENPKNLQFVEADAATLPRVMEDLDGAVINGNFALEGGLAPSEDGLFLEKAEDNPYANLLTVREANKDDENIKKLDELLHSDEVKQFIEDNWKDGTVIPAF